MIKANIGDLETVNNILRNESFDAVTHFAASVVVPESINPLKYYLNNTVETTHFIKACIEYKIDKFIFSSTAAVYGTPNTNYVSEDTQKNQIVLMGCQNL